MYVLCGSYDENIINNIKQNGHETFMSRFPINKLTDFHNKEKPSNHIRQSVNLLIS